VEPAVSEGSTAPQAVVGTEVKRPTIKAKEVKKKPRDKVTPVKKDKPSVPERRQPEMEDREGFEGRRPKVNPYRIGEKVTLGLSYFNMTAGYLDMEVLPDVEVNGARSHRFRVSIKSNSLFSKFYAVDDVATTYVNQEDLLPFNFEISVRESKQIADIRSFFDWPNLKGNYWEKRVSKDKGERSKSIEWEIKPYSQNVISAVFYLRNFTLTPGKKLAFPVADEGRNIVFKGEVLRREKLETEAGTFDTVVVKPQFEVDGVFKPTGDILLWLTNDDRKFIVRIESKIKIGTIVGKLKALAPGRE